MLRSTANPAGACTAFAISMGITLALCISAPTASGVTAETNGHVPKHCESSIPAWWAKYVGRFVESGGRYGVDLANSDPAAGFAHVTWSNGLQQMVTVAEIEGHGACAVERRDISPSS